MRLSKETEEKLQVLRDQMEEKAGFSFDVGVERLISALCTSARGYQWRAIGRTITRDYIVLEARSPNPAFFDNNLFASRIGFIHKLSGLVADRRFGTYGGSYGERRDIGSIFDPDPLSWLDLDRFPYRFL